MKIAQVAPLFESVPPQLYGGTERIVYYLTEELVRLGHDVTLFASGDSRTSATLVSVGRKALRLDSNVRDPIPHQVLVLEEVRRRADRFDVIHFHTDLLHFPLARLYPRKTVTTLHGRLDLPDLLPFYKKFSDVPLVSISDDQRRPMPPVAWAGTVYHGLPEFMLPYNERYPGEHLVFLGRISPEKRPDRAIRIALATGRKLRMAAKVDNADYVYWTEVIRPMVNQHSSIEFIGEIGEDDKAEFLGEAAALLFPIDWPEPFGLVMIEAMSCGTPVIAFRNGSVPEIIEHGVNGLIVTDEEAAVEAVRNLHRLSRRRTRESFEARFTANRMAFDYVRIYEQLTARKSPTANPQSTKVAPEPLLVTG
jgi:glycosyltransferase involved in cell wall biosynthesis